MVRAAGRSGCNGGSVSCMRSHWSSEPVCNLSCLWEGYAWFWGAVTGQCARTGQGVGEERTSPRPASSRPPGVTLTGFCLSLPNSFFIASDGEGEREGSWYTMNRCKGCEPKLVSAPPRGRRRHQRPLVYETAASRPRQSFPI